MRWSLCQEHTLQQQGQCHEAGEPFAVLWSLTSRQEDDGKLAEDPLPEGWDAEYVSGS